MSEPTGPTPGTPGDADLLRERVRTLRAELGRREAEATYLAGALEAQRAAFESVGWRLLTRWRDARDRVLRRRAVPGWLRRGLRGAGGRAAQPARTSGASQDPRRYAEWIERHARSPEELRRRAEEAACLASRPSFSIVTAAASGDEAALAATAASVRAQLWPRAELVVVTAGAASPPELAAAPGGRVRIERRPAGCDEPVTAALEGSREDFVLFVRPGDTLDATALQEVALALEAVPDGDFLYADEDRLLEDGTRVDPAFKPDWSPDLLLATNYVGRFGAFRRGLLDSIATAAPPAGGDRGYDLVLRATERARRVVHVPRLLFHARAERCGSAGGAAPGSGSGADERLAGERGAVAAALERRGIAAAVEATPWPVCRVRYRLRGAPAVSVVIPTRDQHLLLRRCVESIQGRSTWRHVELIVVDNGSRRGATLRYLRALGERHAVIRDPRPFNWSALNNAAAARARGEHLVFMNDDVEVVTPDWLEAMLEHAQRAEVGAVGPKLLYPDGTLQHAGILLGVGQTANHAFQGVPDTEPTYRHLAHAVRDVSAVTGACMMIRRQVFAEAGGFDEGLPVAFNDVDLCLRLQERGLRVVYTPHAVLIHHESATRRKGHDPGQERRLERRWRAVLGRDPYYNENLGRLGGDHELAP